MTKSVTIFGREMRVVEGRWRLGRARISCRSYRGELLYSGFHHSGPIIGTGDYKSPHAAARALERKIIAAHKRLTGIIGEKGRRKS